MLNEKHNEPFHWKVKLDELSSLPGEAVLEKNAAWEKLHGRLEEGPRKKKTIWYWAAACILLAITIPFILANKKENGLVKEIPQQKKNIIEQPGQIQIHPKEPVALISPVQVKRKQPVTVIKKTKIAGDLNIAKENNAVATIAILPVENKAETVLNSIPPADTVVAVVTGMPARKKLQVIHLNELDPSPVPADLPAFVKRSLKLKFGNNKVSNQTFATQQQYTNDFKINLSLKN